MNGAASDGEPTHFGSGWLSGTLSAALGLIGLGAVLCFRYPALLTMPELRALYPLPYVRALLHVVLVSAFLLGAISVTPPAAEDARRWLAWGRRSSPLSSAARGCRWTARSRPAPSWAWTGSC